MPLNLAGPLRVYTSRRKTCAKEAGVTPPAPLFISCHYPSGSDVCFPESVKVAVLVSCYRISCLEDCLGLLAGLKLCELETGLGLKNDELNVVRIHHGMSNGTNLYGYGIAIDISLAASVVPASISFMGSPQQDGEHPFALSFRTMLPHFSHLKSLIAIITPFRPHRPNKL